MVVPTGGTFWNGAGPGTFWKGAGLQAARCGLCPGAEVALLRVGWEPPLGWGLSPARVSRGFVGAQPAARTRTQVGAAGRNAGFMSAERGWLPPRAVLYSCGCLAASTAGQRRGGCACVEMRLCCRPGRVCLDPSPRPEARGVMMSVC